MPRRTGYDRNLCIAVDPSIFRIAGNHGEGEEGDLASCEEIIAFELNVSSLAHESPGHVDAMALEHPRDVHAWSMKTSPSSDMTI
jgi:hypothetical protein